MKYPQFIARRVARAIAQVIGFAVVQLRIRDIAFRWNPRLLNKTRHSSGPVRPRLSVQAQEGYEPGRTATCLIGTLHASRDLERGGNCECIHCVKECDCDGNGRARPSNVPTSERVSLLKRIYPRTAAGLGLWAWGQFSPGKPSTLVVGGSPALGVPDRLGEPRLAILA